MTFGFRRNDYSEEAKVSIDKEIEMELEGKLKGKGINNYRIYRPNRNTVKVVFISEADLNKVYDNKDYFMKAGLTPKTSISIKASRTFFCVGFDPVLLINNNKDNIKHQLEGKHGEIDNIYILRSGRSFKVELKRGTRQIDL